MKAKDFYNVAAYLRLSRDDIFEGVGAESNSIRSQRELIRSFLIKQDNMAIYDYYVDDGWSGTDFNRPSFQRMMEDVENGRVNCVIVKDLSRLGRDYIEAGKLIQKTFPAFSVRFIALNDNFDSLTADFHATYFLIPLKNFINDAYCSDISKKVRSHQRIKWEKGEFIGAFAVYGYRKDPKNRNRLIVDAYAAAVVKKIFAWKIAGFTNLAIAEKLNGLGILSPMEYKRSQGENFFTGFATHVAAKWSAVAVKRILTNEMYLGTMVQGKRERVSYKVKRLSEKPEARWVRVADTHKAVVSAEDFELVQKLLKSDGRSSKGENSCHMFTGFLYCGDCGEPMIRRISRYKGTEKVYFICASKNRGAGCSRHSIPEEELKYVLLTGLRLQSFLFFDHENVRVRIDKMEVSDGEAAVFARELKRLYGERELYRSLGSGLCEDLKKGIITEEDFRDFHRIYEVRYHETEEAVRRQEEMVRKLFQARTQAEKKLEKMKTLPEITEIDRDVLTAFVDRIHVFEDKRVFVKLRFKDMFADTIRKDSSAREVT